MKESATFDLCCDTEGTIDYVTDPGARALGNVEVWRQLTTAFDRGPSRETSLPRS